MDTKFLTPIQLWQDFNPVRELLETAIKDYHKLDEDISFKSLYYTAIGSGENSVRAYAEIFVPTKANKKAVIFISDIKEGISREILLNLAKEGFITASVDLSGNENRGDYTRYKGDFAYGQYEFAKDNLANCSPTAEANPVYLWSRIVRRFLTVFKENYPKAEPICVAAKEACEIAWHLAAMDTRIIGAATLLGNNFGNLVGWNKPREKTDENTDRWDTAISASAYAKFVGCPFLIVTSTNNSGREFDCLEDIIDLLPEDNIHNTIVSPRLSKQISEASMNTVLKWINGIYNTKKQLPRIPELTVSEGGELVFSINPDESEKKALSVNLYYAYNEENALYRNWHKVRMQKDDINNYSYTVELDEEDIKVFAYAEIQYRDIQLNSPPLYIPLDKTEYQRSHITKGKLLFDTGMDNCFFAETDSIVLPKDVLDIKKSVIGIPGITVNKGTLSSYIVGESRRLKYEGVFQISACSARDCNIKVKLIQENEGIYTEYFAERTVIGGCIWDKLSFEFDDFRTADRLPMVNWNNIKKIEFIDAEDILFNNMLWV